MLSQVGIAEDPRKGPCRGRGGSMVRWRGSKPSPLHSTVPLDGSQTVPGLRELERSARSAGITRNPSAQPSKGRPSRKR